MKNILLVIAALMCCGFTVTENNRRNPTQFDLIYRGMPTRVGCAPASIAYLTYILGNPLSAQYILDANARQGTFTWRGMSPSSAHDELAKAGFYSDDFYNETPPTPFLAVVRLHGGNHSVVVVSIEDGVGFYDPWDGIIHQVSRNIFLRIWPCRCGMIVSPM